VALKRAVLANLLVVTPVTCVPGRVVNRDTYASQWPAILSSGATAPCHLLEALAPTSIVGAFSRGQLYDKRKGAGHQNQYLQNLSESSIRLEPVNKSVHFPIITALNKIYMTPHLDRGV
jgi:hypothetical protein